MASMLLMLLIFILHSVVKCSLAVFDQSDRGASTCPDIFSSLGSSTKSSLFYMYKSGLTNLCAQVCRSIQNGCFLPPKLNDLIPQITSPRNDLTLFVRFRAPPPSKFYTKIGAAAPLKCDEYVRLRI